MSWLRRKLNRLSGRLRLREGLVFAAYAGLIVALMSVVRPMFTSMVPAKSYESPVIFWAMLKTDIASIQRFLSGKRLATPYLLFLVVPTVALLVRRRRLRWTDFDSGKSLRNFVVAIVGLLAYSGATAEYNSYLNQGHLLDRALLVGFAVASWFTPVAVPFAVKWALVMIKEAYIPIPQDDFDFRSVPEVLVVFSCFLWTGILRGIKTKHFLFTGICCWASYYFAAGVAKLSIGPEWWSWTLTDHVSNLSMGAHIRGWASWVPDDKFIAFNDFVRKGDLVSTVYTVVVELGALFLFFLRPRISRLMFMSLFVLNFGIYFLTGICFWKWMFTNLCWFFYLGRGGAKPFREMYRPALVVLLMGGSLVFFARGRDYFFPQTGVAWWDSRMVENYLLFAVGRSGKKYFVDTNTFAPSDMHWTQGRLCYATQDRTVTGIYGVTRNRDAVMKLESTTDPKEGMRLIAKGRKCDDPKHRDIFDNFLQRFFRTVNRNGFQHRWLKWIGRPRHLWIFPTNQPRFEAQEQIDRVEMWREVVVFTGGKLHKLETKLTHTVKIEEAAVPDDEPDAPAGD